MAKYFIDTEFIEDFHKPLFGKKRHFIDLISIGIVAEDGREYYAISNEWNYNDADKWVQENVIHKLPLKLMKKESVKDFKKRCKLSPADNVVWVEGKTNKQIAEEIIQFVNSEYVSFKYGHEAYNQLIGTVQLSEESQRIIRQGYTEPEFYGYYADYDWVLFCSLFGRMIDLPKGFPMYMRDLKQTLDEKAECAYCIDRSNNSIRHPDFQKTMYENASGYLNHLKKMADYPKQENEHNSLSDAKWNKKLYKFLNTI